MCIFWKADRAPAAPSSRFWQMEVQHCDSVARRAAEEFPSKIDAGRSVLISVYPGRNVRKSGEIFSLFIELKSNSWRALMLVNAESVSVWRPGNEPHHSTTVLQNRSVLGFRLWHCSHRKRTECDRRTIRFYLLQTAWIQYCMRVARTNRYQGCACLMDGFVLKCLSGPSSEKRLTPRV